MTEESGPRPFLVIQISRGDVAFACKRRMGAAPPATVPPTDRPYPIGLSPYAPNDGALRTRTPLMRQPSSVSIIA